MRKILKNKDYFKERLIISILLFVIFSSVSIGYAYYNTELNIFGNVSLISNNNGILEITSVNENESENATGALERSFWRREENNNIILGYNDFVAFNPGNNNLFTFSITIENNSNKYYKLNEFAWGGWSDGYNVNTPRLVGISKGEEIVPGEKKNILIIYYNETEELKNDTLIWSETRFIFSEGHGNSYLPNIDAVLDKYEFIMEVGSQLANTDIKISNNNDTSIKVTIKSSNPDVVLIDSNGNEIIYTKTLNASSNGSKTVYFKLINPLKENQFVKTNIFLELEDGKIIQVCDVVFF